jgi:hypothetical protein
MYSLLCRHAHISDFNQGQEEDGGIPEGSKFAAKPLGAPQPGRALERSRPLQKALLGVVLLGTAFMFCDGVLSPAASGAIPDNKLLMPLCRNTRLQLLCEDRHATEDLHKQTMLCTCAVMSAVAGIQIVNPGFSDGAQSPQCVHVMLLPCFIAIEPLV